MAADLNKEIIIRLNLDDKDLTNSLDKIQKEIEKLKQQRDKSSVRDVGPITAEINALETLKTEYENLRIAEAKATADAKKNAKTKEQLAKEALAAEKLANKAKADADKAQQKALKEGEKYLKQQEKAAESVANAFLGVARATITIVSTYEQFATATEDQGRLLTKLFQVMGLLQSVQEVYNVSLAINTAITDANALAKTENAIATGTLAVNTEAAAASTGLLTKAIASLGLVGSGVLAGVLGLGAALFVFTKSQEDVRLENDKLFESYKKNYEALARTLEAQIELDKINNPDKYAAQQKALQLTSFFSDKSIDQLKKLKTGYEDQIQLIFKTKDATVSLNESISNLINTGIGKSIFTAEDTKDVVSFNDKIREIDKEIQNRDKQSAESKKEFKINEINQETLLANIKLSALQEELSLNKDIESKRQIALLALQQEINLNNAKLKTGENLEESLAQQAVLNAKFNTIEIEFQREKRLLLLEEFKIQAEIDRAKTNQLNNIEAKLLSITTDRIIAQTELNTAIANGLPTEEAIVQQKSLELQYNNSIYALQLQINEALLESQKTIDETNYQSLIDQLAVPTGDLAKDLENKLTSAGEASARAIVNIQNEINEKIIAAQGDDALVKQLQKELKIRIDAEKSKAKITEDIIKKANAVALAQEELKEFQIRELQATTLKTELANINTTYERRKEINEELLKLQIERIRLQEQIDLKSANTDAEKQRIKETADFAIKEAERVTAETIQKDSIISKLFGSPKDLQLFVDGTKKTAENLKLVFSEFESTSKLGDQFKAIGGSVSEVISLAGTLATTIKGFTKDTTLEEKTAAIAQAVATALNSITNLIVESLNATLDRQIENIDKSLDDLKDKRDLLEEDLSASAERIGALEKNLAEAREGDRARIVALIDQERSRELQLAKDKEKYFNQEQALEAKRKELQKQQFENQKVASIIQATINTAVAVTAALTIPGAGPVLAAIVGALGAVQVGVIASQPTPEFKTGGFTPKDASDDKLVGGVHANEYVLSAPMVRSPRFRPLIEEAERFRLNGYQSGGLVTPFEQTNETIQRTLETAIALSERPIYVQVTALDDALSDQAQLVDLTVL
jgi:hypothetical protein